MTQEAQRGNQPEPERRSRPVCLPDSFSGDGRFDDWFAHFETGGDSLQVPVICHKCKKEGHYARGCAANHSRNSGN